MYVTLHKKQVTFSQQQEEVATLFQKTGKYYGYVQGCLQESAKRALILAGTQGGVIYDAQAPGTKPFLGPPRYAYGTYVLPFSYDDVYNLDLLQDKIIYNVSYGMVKPDLSLQLTSHPQVPDYPYGFRKLVADPAVYDPAFVHVFGNMISFPLPPLCDYYGSNGPDRVGGYNCESYDSRREQDSDSLQEYLEAFIADSFSSCVKLEDFPELNTEQIQKGNVTATVTFTPETVIVDASLPLLVAQGDDYAALHLEQFSTTFSVRLKQIHELVTRLIARDVDHLFFDVQKNAAELNDCKLPGRGQEDVPCLKEGMQVYKYNDVCLSLGLCVSDGRYDDILVVEDKQSLINGKPYLFFVAVENRIPALDVLRDDTLLAGLEEYHYVLEVGDTLTLRPLGYDPDEDNHDLAGVMDANYVYSGWKEDYDEVFNVEECLELIEECLVNPDFAITRTVGASQQRFTNSNLYSTTKRDASLVVDEDDIGPHKLRISVMDNEGLYDYQDINVLVVQSPSLGGYNAYDSVANNYLSVEDPYTFIDLAAVQLSDFDPDKKFLWKIPGVLEDDGVITSIPKLKFPQESSYDIESIDTAMVDFKQYIGGTLAASLQLYDPADDLRVGDASSFTFNVVACLPYYSSQKPYPFSSDMEDPFLSNHACCNPEFTVAASGTTCYEDVAVQCQGNAVYKVMTKAVCDGVRGNRCGLGGDHLTTTSELIQDCGDQTCQEGVCV